MNDSKSRYGESKLVDSFYNESIAKTLKEIRLQNNMSYSLLCKKINKHVSRQTLCKYEAGKTKIRLETFNKIAKAFNMTPQELFAKVNYNYFNDLKEYKDKI